MDGKSSDAEEDGIDEIWRAALADAGIQYACATLFRVPGESSSDGLGAKTWAPGSTIDDPNDMVVLGSQLEGANSDLGRASCRVAVWIDRSPEGIAALIRHELEHNLQFQVHGAVLQRLHDRALNVLVQHAGGLPGSGALYNAIPMEADANAAASRFVRKRYGDERIYSLIRAEDKDAAAFRSTAPPLPLHSLRQRMKAFIETEGPELARAFAERAGT